jgi:hypothetical protein
MVPTTFLGWVLVSAFAAVVGFFFALGAFVFNRLFASGGAPTP